MSEWLVEVAVVTNVQKHPDADSLSVAEVNGYPVIFRTGDYAEGDRAVHIPIDSIVPKDDPRWDFLGGHCRIKAKRLRGVFSMGLLTPADPSWEIGQNVAAELGITKHDPDAQGEGGPRGPGAGCEVGPSCVPKYDIEGIRRNRGLFVPGDEVWISEKIHGQSARMVHDGERLWVGSKNWFKTRAEDPAADCTWWKVAHRYGLEAKLAQVPGIAIYGETYGNNADMRYGANPHAEGADRFVMFDALDTKTGRWLDPDEMLHLGEQLGIPTVPTIFRGPFVPEMVDVLIEGKTTLGGAAHVREGVVIKPVRNRSVPRFGRVFLKAVGQGYLLRKAA